MWLFSQLPSIQNFCTPKPKSKRAGFLRIGEGELFLKSEKKNGNDQILKKGVFIVFGGHIPIDIDPAMEIKDENESDLE